MKGSPFKQRVLLAIPLFVVAVLAIVACFMIWNLINPQTLAEGVHEDFFISCDDTGRTHFHFWVTTEVNGGDFEVRRGDFPLFPCTATPPDSSASHDLNLSGDGLFEVNREWNYCDSIEKRLQADIVIDNEDYDQVLPPFTCVDRLADT